MKSIFKIFICIFFFFISSYAFAQNKIVIDDRTSILNAQIEKQLQQKFLEKNLFLTNSVDFREKCNYYFASITKETKGYLFEVRDCDDRLLGSYFAGSNLGSISDQEKEIIVFYNLWEIIENPTYPEIKSESKPTDVEDAENYANAVYSEHDSRYFFAPSALPLKKGELYYNSLYFLAHDIQYGINDHLTVGMGTTIFGFPFYLTAKYSIPIQENSHLAFGDLLMVGTYGTNFFGNLAFATYTYGNSHNNISIGAGHLYFSPEDGSEISSSIVGNLSGIVRAGTYFYFLSENYLFSFKATESATRSTQLSDGTWLFESAEYETRRNIWYGLTGIRFVRKSNELVSWQFGLTHMLFVSAKAPAPYDSPQWETNSFNSETRMIAFPTFSFTRKFKL
ncbi:hypothetical protein MATR_08170 [Marivirga tractuosa]|uniref:Secreted protein n=1 Tax=Marivirga tractuosa (strain ATCC 23168 / DSM 4126 / NBRC 15989 / NCIMB 1408 / VKM B-1430 / H-43) TaxID=643867 RepID=E4TPG5_MARTH|nr:hypothetical protein [Marivirga tractuosa]ADR21553.1 hypothetical protein Ftrac_1563 [Marivirga tractuosa DSM 4126]BDD13992.1 hypothetical protein MATR_08170 [Marivirga tractuosa]